MIKISYFQIIYVKKLLNYNSELFFIDNKKRLLLRWYFRKATAWCV